MSPRFAPTPAPPCYAVIFSSLWTEGGQGYGAMAGLMDEMARQQPGSLGIESARDELGFTASYWRDEESIRGWKTQPDHPEDQRQGRAQWYPAYPVRVSKVERAYGFTSDKLI